jgi:hypothetical protein
MTYSVTVNAGVRGLVFPNGIRYRPADQIPVPDRQYSLMTAGAKSLLTPGPGGTAPTGSLGGSVSHQVTINAGLKNVVLPNGLRYGAGAVVVLSDDEYNLIPAYARATLFSADTTTLT